MTSILGNDMIYMQRKLGIYRTRRIFMNKEEILIRAQKFKEQKDEREVMIEHEGCNMAFTIIISVNALLIVILFLQKFFTGKQFANPDTFILAFLLGYLGKYYVKYQYEKEKSDFYMMICMIIGSLCCLMNIIGTGMEWF